MYSSVFLVFATLSTKYTFTHLQIKKKDRHINTLEHGTQQVWWRFRFSSKWNILNVPAIHAIEGEVHLATDGGAA